MWARLLRGKETSDSRSFYVRRYEEGFQDSEILLVNDDVVLPYKVSRFVITLDLKCTG